jgi:dTDP-4-dehydrorhamnose reductase
VGLGQCLCPEYRNDRFRYWVVRTAAIFEQPGFRASRNLFYRYTQMARGRRGYALPAATDTCWSATYAPHLAEAIVWLATHYQEVVSGVYHICNEGAMSAYDLFSTISYKVDGLCVAPCSLQEMARRLDFDEKVVPRNTALNCDKWNEIAPFKMPTIDSAITEFASKL